MLGSYQVGRHHKTATKVTNAPITNAVAGTILRSALKRRITMPALWVRLSRLLTTRGLDAP